MGQVELEKLLDLTPEHLAFHLWYLREKGWIQRLETGLLAITAEGVDQVERDRVQLEPERLIESHVPGDSRPEPAAPTAVRTGPASRATIAKRLRASSADIASIVATCRRGITTVWPSASGEMSRNATAASSFATISAGISPAAIRQKMQLMSPA